MRIKLHLFAQLAELAQTRTIDLKVPPHATVADALEVVFTGHPELAPLKGRIAVAKDDAYVPPDTPLADGTELSLIPPVSGG